MTALKRIDQFSGTYRWLSNFHPAPVAYEGVEYPSVEHAYQASKFPKDERSLFLSGTAADAKHRGKRARLQSDWLDNRISIMEDLVRQKFSNHPELKQDLLKTGNAELIEGNYWGDHFWGTCNGRGENNLGKAIMRVRKHLQEK